METDRPGRVAVAVAALVVGTVTCGPALEREVGPRWSVLTVASDATSVSVLTFGVEGSLAVEPWRFASHALYLEARASAIVPWRGLDFGPITLAFTIGGGFRY